MRLIRGFTLIELLISLLVGGVLIMASLSVVSSMGRVNTKLFLQSQMQVNARFAKMFISHDLHKAGFYGGLDSDSKIDGSVSLKNNPTTCPVKRNELLRTFFPRVSGWNDTNEGVRCVDNKSYLRGDILVSHFSVPILNISRSKRNKKKLYLSVSNLDGKVFEARDRLANINQFNRNNVNHFEIGASVIYIKNSGRKCEGKHIPALFREQVNSKGVPVAEEIVTGVEHLQFQYWIGNRLLNADEIDLESDWQSVSAVQVWMLMRSECPLVELINDGIDKTYFLGDVQVKDSSLGEGYIRSLYRFDVALRN